MFKNWSAICEISDRNLQMAIARCDPESPVGRRLQAAFPECFSETETQELFPVSMLMEISREKGEKLGGDRSKCWSRTMTLR